MTREEKQKAIEALKIFAPVTAVTQEEFNNYIQILNQVMDWLEQEPRWIPVTERLPDKDGLYLVSVKNDHERRYSKTCWYSDKNWFARQDVVAWMPLPQPYKAESEET